MYAAISECADLLDQYGGHTHAAGLTLPVDQVVAFQEKFESVVARSIQEKHLIPRLDIEQIISLDEITPSFYNVLKQMAPFGPGNMRPIFVSENLITVGYPQVLKEKHLKFTVRPANGGNQLGAIGFGMAHLYPLVDNQRPFRMAYNIEENHYNGNTSLQLAIRDIKKI